MVAQESGACVALGFEPPNSPPSLRVLFFVVLEVEVVEELVEDVEQVEETVFTFVTGDARRLEFALEFVFAFATPDVGF